MAAFVMLTRVSPKVLSSPRTLEELERRAMDRILAECPNVKWVHSYAVLGPYDYVDIFEAPDIDTAVKVSTLIRTYGRASSEIWPATEWRKFKQIISSLTEQGQMPPV